jgi:hypothetical protein
MAAESVEARGTVLHCGVHRLADPVWNKELPKHWNKSVVASVCKKSDKMSLEIS